MKKIALSVVLASSFALAACGGNTAANNTADVNATVANAVDSMNQAASDMQNQAAATVNQVTAATNQAVAATTDAANQMSAAAANATNAH